MILTAELSSQRELFYSLGLLEIGKARDGGAGLRFTWWMVVGYDDDSRKAVLLQEWKGAPQ